MTNRDFRKVQGHLDKKEIFTRIQRNHKKQYSLFINYLFIKNFKQRRSAKEYTVRKFQQQLEDFKLNVFIPKY